jgi:nicotinamide mononucleotide (NMN) deamidase PncC
VAPTAGKLCHLLNIDSDNQTDGTSADERTKRLAAAAADTTASQWAVAVGDTQRDENGAGYVQVAFKLPEGHLESRQVRLSGSGELARSRLSTQLLDQLRRRLK